MGKEIKLLGADTTATHDVVIYRDSDLWVYNGTAFEAYSSANYATYSRALTQVGATGNFYADFPALPAGVYLLDYRKRTTAGTPAEADSNAGGESFDWNGTARVRSSNVRLDLTQPLDQNATGTTLGGALFASWASTWGKRVLDKVTKTLKWYKDDNATLIKTVTLDSATVPTTVTP